MLLTSLGKIMCISNREFSYGIVSTSRPRLVLLISWYPIRLLFCSMNGTLTNPESAFWKLPVSLFPVTGSLFMKGISHFFEVEGVGNEESGVCREGVDQIVNFSSCHVCHPFVHLRHT